jgi:hypothetical protein
MLSSGDHAKIRSVLSQLQACDTAAGLKCGNANHNAPDCSQSSAQKKKTLHVPTKTKHKTRYKKEQISNLLQATPNPSGLSCKKKR